MRKEKEFPIPRVPQPDSWAPFTAAPTQGREGVKESKPIKVTVKTLRMNWTSPGSSGLGCLEVESSCAVLVAPEEFSLRFVNSC